MAHRIITQVVITGSRVFGRAFAEAWRQAQASQKYAAAHGAGSNLGGSGGSSHAATAATGLTLEEACKILNVAPPKSGTAAAAAAGGAASSGASQELERVTERFKKLFDLNDPRRGGSFYLQSKILRARERIEAELKEAEEAADMQEEVERGGWKPKMYKDRR